MNNPKELSNRDLSILLRDQEKVVLGASIELERHKSYLEKCQIALDSLIDEALNRAVLAEQETVTFWWPKV